MDSLLANYASASSDSDSDEEKGPEFNPSRRASLVSSSPPLPKGESNSSSSSIFTALPPPKNNNSYLPLPSPSPSLKPQRDDVPKATSSLFSSLPLAKARSGFSLPPPKNKSGKRVVEFKPPLNPALLENLDDEERYDRASKKRAVSDDSETLAGGLTALLPPPKNDNVLGAGGGAHTGRRFFVETAHSTYHPPPDTDTDVREEPSLDLHHSFHSYSGGSIAPSQNEYYYSADPPSQGVYFGSSGGAGLSHGNQYPQPCPPQEAAYVQGNETTKVLHQVSDSAGSSFGKVEERKRGRNQIPSNVIEVKQDELMGNRPREDQAKLTASSTPHQQPIHHPHQNYHPTNNHYTIIKMDKAKAAITDFMGRSGHHDTTVHEAVAPAVQHEVIKPHVHEEINTAIDKEVHQDHYHRTVQPVHDREVLPEQHTAKLGAVQHREFDHRDADATKRALIDDQARFADERRIEDTTHSQSVAPTVGGEHVHHHIHETIQPVVQKETIQPNVVHTTVPIHEVHHNKATHHETTALPAMTMEQFKAKGGALTGREERYDEFEGVPKNIGGAGGIGAAAGLAHKTTSHGHEHARHGDYDATPNHHSDAGLREGGLTHNSTTTGTHNPLDRNNDGKVSAKDLTGSHSNTSHTDRGVAGQGNLTGSSTQGGVVGSGVGDRNHDGKIDSQDLRDPARSGNHGATGTKDPSGHVVGGTDKGHMEHRPNEDGSLPKALTEDRSKAIPHSQASEEEARKLESEHEANKK